MPILASVDFVGHVTTIEMEKIMITDTFLISLHFADFRSNMIFSSHETFTTVMVTTRMSEVA